LLYFTKMASEFKLNKAPGFVAVKKANCICLRFASFFKNVFLGLFFVFLIVIGLSFINAAPGYLSLKLLVLFFSLYIIFWELDSFLETKIKNPIISVNIKDVVTDPQNYNLAELLNFDATKTIEDAIGFCKKKKLYINSTALLHSVIQDKYVSIVCFRLGLDPKKLKDDVKNYLEKSGRNLEKQVSFSEDFFKILGDAVSISVNRQKNSIGPEEIFCALARNDDFFKKVLVECDLKPEDIENLTLWLDSAKKIDKKRREFWSYENLQRLGSFGKDFSFGYTVTLDQFSIDWRKIVSNWRFREIIGHAKEIERTELVLAKSNLSNVLLVGEPGTGRKSIIEALAQRCYLGTSMPELNNKRVVELDTMRLAAQISDFEKLEVVLDQIFSEAVVSGNIILFINDIENLVSHRGQQKAGTFDISGVLAKYLPIPEFKFVAITSYEGLHSRIEKESSFAGMFEKVEVPEVTESETINILQSAALEEEYRHKVFVLYPSIREIVNLTARYMPSLSFPRKALDVLDESVVYVQKLKEKVVLPHHIADIISKKTEIPVGKMDVKEKEVLLNLEKLIHERIVNQAEAVNEISIAMRRARIGIASKTRPMGSFLFLGPTGVGKTETAKALAKIYFGSEKKMIRIDMSEFQAIPDIQRLIGSADGQIQGLFTTQVRETPFSLILLDEIEKAHPNILNLFLQVLDEGHITDGQGRKVVFSSTIIICTSNAGADIIFKQVGSGEKLEKDKLLSSLFEKNIFRPEFVNRFDATVIFHPLTKDNLMQIAQLSLKGLQKNLKEKDIDFVITDDLKSKIVDLSYKPEFGAREMRRVIQDKVENAVASAMLSEKLKKGDKFEIDPETFDIKTGKE